MSTREDHIPSWVPRGHFGTLRLPQLTRFLISPVQKQGRVALVLEADAPENPELYSQRAAIAMTPEQVNALIRDFRLALNDIS